MTNKAAVSARRRFTFAVIANSLLSLGLICSCAAQTQQTSTDCPDGRYEGRLSGKKRYMKDEYVWAVTAEFAKRFCMPASFIADDLKGAEAIAYQLRPSEGQMCEMKDGQEVCEPRMKVHWLEIYVKSSANIPKYDAEVKYFVDSRDVSNSAKLINHAGTAGGERAYARNVQIRNRGETVEAPGNRAPFFGRGDAADGKRIFLSYVARVDKNKIFVMPDGLSEHFYQANWFEDIDLIALSGWANGSITDPRLPIAKYGYAIVPRVEYDKSELRKFPEEFTHVIYMPERIVNVWHEVDRKGGEAFQQAIRNMLQGKPHSFSK